MMIDKKIKFKFLYLNELITDVLLKIFMEKIDCDNLIVNVFGNWEKKSI